MNKTIMDKASMDNIYTNNSNNSNNPDNSNNLDNTENNAANNPNNIKNDFMKKNTPHNSNHHSMSAAQCLKRLYSEYVSQFKVSIYIVICCAIIGGICMGLNAWIMRPVLDDIFVNKSVKMLTIIPLVIVANAIIKGIAYFYQSALLKIVGHKVVANIQMALYKHLMLDVSIDHFAMQNSGNFISKFVHEIAAIKKCINDTFVELIGEVIGIAILVSIMILQSPELSLIACVIFPSAFLVISLFSRHIKRLVSSVYCNLESFTKLLDESFINIVLIRSYCRESYEIRRATNLLNKMLRVYKRSAFFESASSPIMEAIGFLAIAFVIWYGGNQVVDGVTTPGSFFSFVTALIMAYKPLKAISKLYTSIQEGVVACNKIFACLDDKSNVISGAKCDKEGKKEEENSRGAKNIGDIDAISVINDGFIDDARIDSKVSLVDIDDIRQSIAFEHVFFRYDYSFCENELERNSGEKFDKPENKYAIHDLSFEVKYGQTIGIIGASGSGKSTILRLLQRFYDTNSGSILIDGRDIKSISPHSLREKMAIVTQNTMLFDDTILENIRYGNLSASDKDVESAAKKADIDYFIQTLPRGYHTRIGGSGMMLSGGQRQKLAIARAIIRSAPVLLLDEPTSALDPISEENVFRVFNDLIGNQITIIVTHKASLLDRADMILKVKDGSIVHEYK